MQDQDLLKHKKKFESVLKSMEKRRERKKNMEQDLSKIQIPHKIGELKQCTVSRHLSDFTFIHEIRKFDPGEVRKAYYYQLTFDDSKENYCDADVSCRALPYRKSLCYLHWLLKKKESDV